MKTVYSLFTCFLLLISFLGISQPTIQWQKSLGGSNTDIARSIQQTLDGGYIVVGETSSTDGDVTGYHGTGDSWVVKLNNNGDIIWEKCFGGSNSEWLFSVQQTSDLGYILAGYTNSNDGDVSGNHSGAYDVWVLKLDSGGGVDWQNCLGSIIAETGLSVRQTTDGGYIVAGTSGVVGGDVTSNQGNLDYWIVKLDNLGTIDWQKSIGGSGSDYLTSIEQTIDGGYIAVGFSESSNGDASFNNGWLDYWVVKLDSTGSIIWEKSYGGTAGERAMCIQQTFDKGFIVAGYSDSNDGDVSGHHNTSSYDFWVIKIDSMGVLIWQKCLGGTGDDSEPYSIIQTTDGGYALIGYTTSNDGDVFGHHNTVWEDYWVVKLDNLGNIDWQKCLGGSTQDLGFSIKQTTDGGYVVAGASGSVDGDVTGNHGGFDFWVVKLSSPVDVNENSDQAVFNVYPNPVVSVLTIKTDETPSLYSITDLSGRIIKQHVIDNNSINVSYLPSGIYFLKLITDDGLVTKKFIKK